ncbi:type 1 glutamine amidotransferase family protein [Clostridium saccharobutylicum]|uniref:Protease YdeA n=2 Tax=Clostridium saccharobutylicum TaxID=169679 RepID=U5MPL0_CLOSA|nr:type 1 glutamine amidotransferase family protein [Clostridium saccharobutylicum]AGX42510.1 protease YdeA [Clostridium saccharobutylicum DSM 13864]MBA2906697.1 putative intracellular protease/amidase [Clostridium saccharobutylicum]MBA8897984.1 putative intracellular protease/amidase [Clostridium saccharobutylicum]NSA17668.1 putative intracellular protease/amidase [Clostridium saccharobutylicum]NSB49533.1 putative intracellular protease/amidase [Clostridium saccharobutylicum]
MNFIKMTYRCHLFRCTILKEGSVTMKKEILVFIFDGYADWESAYICSELNGAETDYIVKTLSLDKEPKISMGGFRIMPDYSVSDYPNDFAMLLLIGGYAWMEQKNNDIQPVVEYAVKHHIPVAAICNASNFMAENGYLDNIEHSGNTLDYMESQAPHYKGNSNFIEKQAVECSGIITANGTASLEFAKEIMLYLNVKPVEKINEWYKFNKLGLYQQ